jgi:uncharacterized protein YjiS (DUF1127 family)
MFADYGYAARPSILFSTLAALPFMRVASAISAAMSQTLKPSAVQVSRSRARLSELDDHMLADIGLTHAEALTEAQRPFWDMRRA